jgi:hypothetical protein
MGKLVVAMVVLTAVGCRARPAPARPSGPAAQAITPKSDREVGDGRPDGIFCGTSLADTALRPPRGRRETAGSLPPRARPRPRTASALTMVLDPEEQTVLAVLVAGAPALEACLALDPAQRDDHSGIELTWLAQPGGRVE